MDREEGPCSYFPLGEDIQPGVDDGVVRLVQSHVHGKESPSLSTAYSAVPSYSASVPSTVALQANKTKYSDDMHDSDEPSVEMALKKQRVETTVVEPVHSRRDNIIISPFYDCDQPHPFLTYPQGPVAFPQAVDGPLVMATLAGLKQSEQRFPTSALRGTSHAQRRVVVDWSCELSEIAQLNCFTAHLAVRYFDIAWYKLTLRNEHVQYQGNKLQLLMLGCLYIACKFYEPARTMQKYGKKFADTLLYIANITVYTSSDQNKMERLVLELLEWRMNIPIAVQFIEVITHCGVLFQSDQVQNKPAERSHISYLRKYISFFAELQLQENAIVHYAPSVASAAVLVCARRAVGVSPIYNPLLFKTTGQDPAEFYNCYVRLYEFYLKSFGDIDRSTEESVYAFLQQVHNSNQSESGTSSNSR